MFDSVSAEYIITGLALTNKWKDSLEILDTIRITCKPSSITYSSVASAAFANNEDKLGWELLDQALSKYQGCVMNKLIIFIVF